MRRLLAILAVFALVVAACDPGTDTDAVETTGSAATADVGKECYSHDGYGAGEACANYSSAESAPRDAPVPGDAFRLDRPEHDHFCFAYPDQVLVFPDDAFSAADFGLEEMTVEDFEEIGVENPEEVVAYLAEVPLGIFRMIDESDLFQVIDQVEQETVGAVMASPHYLLTPGPAWEYGPHGAPTRISGAWSDVPPTGTSEGEGRVVIIDTGTTGDTATIGIDTAEPEGNVDPQVAGHGLFAASVVRQFSEAVNIDVYEAATGGLLSEASIMGALQRAAPDGADVVNLSLGTYPCRAEDPPLGLIQTLGTLPGDVHVTASSGNDGNQHPTMFPASLGFPNSLSHLPQGQLDLFAANGIDVPALSARITAVGATDMSGTETTWSNPAEIYAPGEDVVGWYHGGVNDTGPSGLAVWSGTSFAAPHFAACLASQACTPP